MINNEIVFNFNDKDKIKFELEDNLEILHPFDDAIIKFYQNNNEYILSQDCIKYEIETFFNLITAAINNQSKIHNSISKDIGYLWNEELQDKPGLIYHNLNGEKSWVGLDYLLWSTPGFCNPKLSTWLYNNNIGEIILEITPSYPWHFIDIEDIKDENLIPYEEWIKTYKPLIKTVITENTALKWKNQAKNILDQIIKNIKENEK